MAKELLKTLFLDEEAYQETVEPELCRMLGESLIERLTALAGLPPRQPSPRMDRYRLFDKLLAEKGYVVMHGMSFAPGPGALPTSIAVLGGASERELQADISSAIEQTSLGPYKQGVLYNDLYDSAQARKLRRGFWVFQGFNLAFGNSAHISLYGSNGAQSPDSFRPNVPSIESVVRQLEREGYVTLLARAEFNQRPSWTTPISVIVARKIIPQEGTIFNKGAFGSFTLGAGLPAYSSGEVYFSQGLEDVSRLESSKHARLVPL